MSVVNGVPVVMPPPEDYVVDFDNPQRQYVTQYHGVYIGGMLLMLFFVGQNIYVRWIMQRRFKDPATICLLIAWASSTTCQSLTLWWFSIPAVGLHAWEIPLERFIFFLEAFTLQAAAFNLVTLFAKLSILLFYYQLSPQRWWRWCVRITGCVVSGYCFALFFAVIFACNPINKAWDVTITEGTCIDTLSMFKATASLGIATDLVMLALPFPLIFQLHMKTPQKIGIIFVFVIGSMTFITSIIRLVLLFSPAFGSPDQTWDMCYTIIWAIIEIQLLVICPSLCTLRAFARQVAPSWMGDCAKPGAYVSNQYRQSSYYRKSYRTIADNSMSKKADKYGDNVEDDAVFLGSFSKAQVPHKVTVERHNKRSDSPSSGETATETRAWSCRPTGDDLERGIVQTRVITITNTPAPS